MERGLAADQFQPITRSAFAAKETQRIIYSARTLNELVHGKTVTRQNWSSCFRFSPNRQPLPRIRGLKRIFGKTRFQLKELKSLRLSELSDNPICASIDWIPPRRNNVSLADVYEAINGCFRKQRKPVSIDLQGFDAFITCRPLNLQPRNTPVFVQTVHDLIALNTPHNENMRQFTHRLQACLPAQRIHVSTSTCRNFTTTSCERGPGAAVGKTPVQPPR